MCIYIYIYKYRHIDTQIHKYITTQIHRYMICALFCAVIRMHVSLALPGADPEHFL